MDSEIYNNLLQKISSLLTINDLSPKQVIDMIKKDIKDQLSISIIGRVSFEVYNSDGTIIKKTVLYSEEYEDEVVSTQVSINKETYIVINVFAKKNQFFDIISKKQIEILSSLYIALYSHASMTEQAKRMSEIDMQTGLPNVKGVLTFGKTLKRKNKLSNYASIFMNLREYSIINKKYGTHIGNLYLKKYTEAISRLIDEEEIIGRPGGNNFVCLVKKEKLQEFIDKISAVEIKVEGKTELIKSRMGVYKIEEIDTPNEAIDNALIALNMCKVGPDKNFVVFDDNLKQKIERERMLNEAVKHAIKNDEFVPFYQPKVDSKTNTLIGAEALVRWKRNDEIISPGEFIPIIEKEDLICWLDLYILRRVCSDINEMLKKGLTPVKVSVNFSKKHFHHPDFAKEIIDIVNEFEIPYELIEIELTETVKEEDYAAMANFAQIMQDNGFAVSIDDFGTGYSSFSLIKDLNISTIKIDKMFVDNISRKKDKIVVKNMIKMIKELGINVIAEGVETPDQIEILGKLGCYNIQGYYYDKPLSKEEYVKRLINPKYK